MLLPVVLFPSFPVLIVFLFFFRSRTLLLARRTCRRRKHFCDGPRKQPTNTPESMSKTSLSPGGTVSPSMPSSTETGAQTLSQKSKSGNWQRKSLFYSSPYHPVREFRYQQKHCGAGKSPQKLLAESAAKSVSLSATVVGCHNNTKFGRSHNFQLITAAHQQFGQMLSIATFLGR